MLLQFANTKITIIKRPYKILDFSIDIFSIIPYNNYDSIHQASAFVSSNLMGRILRGVVENG